MAAAKSEFLRGLRHEQSPVYKGDREPKNFTILGPVNTYFVPAFFV
ncbi:hypothetical protein SAMN05216308_11512 [Nitrosospira sp. Nsp13]|jgi:hypothetical protein|nr:hypothetical protein SAMN05216308_11512 [Nitrosospira sp. Nsp13]